MYRSDFLNVMVELLQDDVSMFNHTCTSYTPDCDGVTLHFIGQPDTKADVIIASDGIKSRMRAHIYGRKNLPLEKQMAHYSEWVIYRGFHLAQ